MFPVSHFVVAIAFTGFAVAGAFIGTATGCITLWVSKRPLHGIWRDAVLGAVGLPAGFAGCIAVPFPRNTISYVLDGGIVVTSTMNTYQHPERVGVALSVLLPLMLELYKFKRARAR